MIKANDISRKSWIKYNDDSDFPIQNIPFGAFKLKNGEIHVASIIGDTVISLTTLEELGYFKDTSLIPQTFTENLNKFLEQGKQIWREIRDKIAIIFDVTNTDLQHNLNHKQQTLFKLENIAEKRWGDNKKYIEYKKNTPIFFPKIF